MPAGEAMHWRPELENSTKKVEALFWFLRCDGDIKQDSLVCGVELQDIMRTSLLIPVQLAGIGIERDDAVGVEIRSLARFSVEIRGRVADAPVDQIQVRIIRARQPGRAAAML